MKNLTFNLPIWLLVLSLVFGGLTSCQNKQEEQQPVNTDCYGQETNSHEQATSYRDWASPDYYFINKQTGKPYFPTLESLMIDDFISATSYHVNLNQNINAIMGVDAVTGVAMHLGNVSPVYGNPNTYYFTALNDVDTIEIYSYFKYLNKCGDSLFNYKVYMNGELNDTADSLFGLEKKKILLYK